MDYVCTDGTSGTLEIPGDGSAVNGPSLQTGTVCDIAERASAPQSADRTPASNVDRPSITIGDSTTESVTVTRTQDAAPAADVSGDQTDSAQSTLHSDTGQAESLPSDPAGDVPSPVSAPGTLPADITESDSSASQD